MLAMRLNAPRTLGVFLLLGSFVLVVLNPREFNVLHCFAFLACFTLGWLLLLGMIGLDPRVRRLLAEVGRIERPGPLDARDVPERTFRYLTAPRARLLVTAVCTVLGIGQFSLGCFLAWCFPGSVWERFLLASVCGGSGLLTLWYIYRHRQLYIAVSPTGLTARLYFRSTTISWDDIVALLARRYNSPFGPVGTVYAIYSLRDKISFTDRLAGASELCALLARITGIAWR
jgi:hypothetical protein